MVFLPFTAQSLLYLLTRIFFWPLRCILFPCYCTCCLVRTKLLISPLAWMIISSNVLLQVASVTFDLLLLLVLGSYLIILFTFLVITTRVPSHLNLSSFHCFLNVHFFGYTAFTTMCEWAELKSWISNDAV
jgi:hypothetical protein